MNSPTDPTTYTAPQITDPTRKKRVSKRAITALSIVLILIIGGIFFAWKPWSAESSTDTRTITVTGESSIAATPDEYTFNPQYEFKNAGKQTALANAATQTNDIVAKLKVLGVADRNIKIDTSGQGAYYSESDSTYYTGLTIVTEDEALSQKVQDYLLTTSPEGAVSPYADFKDATRKKLTSTARDEATKDARTKAEQSAKNLGFKVGAVKSVEDNPDSGISRGATAANDTAQGQSLTIQPGQSSLDYTVKVIYYIH